MRLIELKVGVNIGKKVVPGLSLGAFQDGKRRRKQGQTTSSENVSWRRVISIILNYRSSKIRTENWSLDI